MAADLDAELPYVLLERHHVSLGNADGKDHNTIVLGGTDVVVPVEMDVDGDPLQDDVVQLCGLHGRYVQTLSSRHADVVVDEERGLLHYRFRHVPHGMFRLRVRIGDSWVPIGRDLLVCREGVFLGGRKLTAEEPAFVAAPEPPPGEEPRIEREGCGH